MLVGVYWTDVEDWYLEWLNGGLVWKGENVCSFLFRNYRIPKFCQMLHNYSKTYFSGYSKMDKTKI